MGSTVDSIVTRFTLSIRMTQAEAIDKALLFLKIHMNRADERYSYPILTDPTTIGPTLMDELSYLRTASWVSKPSPASIANWDLSEFNG